jgi:teichuronic acid biosynthesis glycosyltransferase TuaC
MKVFIIQSGFYTEDGALDYSITSKRQIASLIKKGLTVKVGLVTSRTNLFKIRENIRQLKEEVAHFNPDVIHSHYGSMVGFVASKVAADKHPLVVSFCGDDLLGTPNKGAIWAIRESLAKTLSRNVAIKANRIIVKSDNLKNALPKACKSKSIVTPNGVDELFFKPAENKDKLRLELGWNTDEFIVFFNASVGSNRTVKNPDLAYATVEELNSMGVKARIEEVNKLSPIEFQKRMSASDCLLVTSLHEGSPNIVKEAMACNIPIVSVACGDVNVRLENVNIGGVYSYDKQELAEAIKKVSTFNKLYNGRSEFMKQGLGEQRISEMIINTYEKASIHESLLHGV